MPEDPDAQTRSPDPCGPWAPTSRLRPGGCQQPQDELAGPNGPRCPEAPASGRGACAKGA
eukprot:12567475-Alexandrium_andersonii.AAC.1